MNQLLTGYKDIYFLIFMATKIFLYFEEEEKLEQYKMVKLEKLPAPSCVEQNKLVMLSESIDFFILFAFEIFV